MKVTDNEFKKQLEQYIQFRGIDIILHLKDGTVIELDKNRKMDGDIIVRNTREGKRENIHLDEV
ncbi:MAG TPA: hypothetical protein PLW55_08315, partial [Leptospiraceae bacterium]|nr:hypothetical protein [Leptospiraceae bacterium]